MCRMCFNAAKRMKQQQKRAATVAAAAEEGAAGQQQQQQGEEEDEQQQQQGEAAPRRGTKRKAPAKVCGLRQALLRRPCFSAGRGAEQGHVHRTGVHGRSMHTCTPVNCGGQFASPGPRFVPPCPSQQVKERWTADQVELVLQAAEACVAQAAREGRQISRISWVGLNSCGDEALEGSTSQVRSAIWTRIRDGAYGQTAEQAARVQAVLGALR